METIFIREVTVQYRGQRKKAPIAIKSPEDVAGFIRPILTDNSREHLVCLYLDGAHQIIAYAVLASGTATQCLVGSREIFQRAVLVGAVAIILCHNHPSGNVQPSAEDVHVTDMVRQGGKLLGIKLLDHVIISDHAVYSFEMHKNVLG